MERGSTAHQLLFTLPLFLVWHPSHVHTVAWEAVTAKLLDRKILLRGIPCQGSAQMLLTLPDERCAGCVGISSSFLMRSTFFSIGYRFATGQSNKLTPRNQCFYFTWSLEAYMLI